MTNKRTRQYLSEEDIDDVVVSHADDDGEWEAPVSVKPLKWRTIRLPEELAARAAHFATLHGAERIDDWIRRVVRERVEAEEKKRVGSSQ